MRKSPLFPALVLGVSVVLAEPAVVEMGDGQVAGLRIKPYQHVWHQCAVQDGEWTDGGTLVETAIEVKDGERMLRVEQSTERPDGVRGQAVMHFSRKTLAPHRLERRHFDPDGKEVASSIYKITPKGYTGEVVRGGDTQTVSGTAVTSRQFSGSNLGLALAALDPEKDFPAKLPASMIQFDAGYRVIATVAGRDTLDTPHGPVESWMIDVEWHHLGQGDVYPPGPDASGGRYWIVPNPPAGVPYVPRYKTDTYAVESVPGACPETG